MRRKLLAISFLLGGFLYGCGCDGSSEMCVPLGLPAEWSTGGSVMLPPMRHSGEWTEPASSARQSAALKECSERAKRYSKNRGRTVVAINVVRSVTGNWLCVFQEY